MQLFKLRQLLLKGPNLPQLSFILLLQDPNLDHVLATNVVVMMGRGDSSRQMLMMMVVVVRVRRTGTKHWRGASTHEGELCSHMINLRKYLKTSQLIAVLKLRYGNN